MLIKSWQYKQILENSNSQRFNRRGLTGCLNIYKVELENILREKINYNSGHYLNIASNSLKSNKIFKEFFRVNIKYDDDDELEISEIYKIIQNKYGECIITENLLEDLISHYTDYRSEDGKTIKNISCNLWNKQQEILESFENKFNKPEIIENNTNNYISIYDSYILYCKYSNNNNKILTVSKKYFEKYIIKLIPNEFIWNNTILLSYWN